MDHFEELVKEFLEGNNKAFEAIYMATYKNVYFTCLSFLKNEKDAEDVTQDVYEAVYKNVKTLKNPENLQVWIYKIAVNKCKNVLKKEKAILVEEETLENVVIEKNENFLPEEYITEKSKRKIVMDIMRKKLSDIQYQTVILFYFNELSVEEIADIMECPPGTVKYRLSVSRAKIKEGVLEYEKQSRDKLYSFAPIPFLTGLLAMEAEAAETPEMWSGIVQRLNILQGGMVAGATHTACQVAAEGLASEGAETLHSEGKVIAERAVIDTMKGSRFMDKLGKILLSIFKNKIVVGIVVLVVIAALAVAVINVAGNDENNSDKIEVVQNGSAANTADETDALPDEDTDIREYDGDGDPYFYKENSWLGTHDYSTGQLESQPEVVICPTSNATITLPFTPEQIQAQVPSYHDYYLTTTQGAYLLAETRDERFAAEFEFTPEWAENTQIVAYNLSEGDMAVEDWINNNYVVIQSLGSVDEAVTEIFGIDLSEVEDTAWDDDAYTEVTLEFLTEQFGSPTHINYNSAGYIFSDNVIEYFYTSMFFVWEFDDYSICVFVSEDFKENENGEYVADLSNLEFAIYSPSAWNVLKSEMLFVKGWLGENQIDEIYSDDFLMPFDCEFPQIESESQS